MGKEERSGIMITVYHGGVLNQQVVDKYLIFKTAK